MKEQLYTATYEYEPIMEELSPTSYLIAELKIEDAYTQNPSIIFYVSRLTIKINEADKELLGNLSNEADKVKLMQKIHESTQYVKDKIEQVTSSRSCDVNIIKPYLYDTFMPVTEEDYNLLKARVSHYRRVIFANPSLNFNPSEPYVA